MQVLFNTPDRPDAWLRAQAEARLRFVLRRLADRVPLARIHLSDINGPRGGVDKRCQVALITDDAGRIVVTGTAGDWRTAIDRALARAARFLMRLRGRQRGARRRHGDAGVALSTVASGS